MNNKYNHQVVHWQKHHNLVTKKDKIINIKLKHKQMKNNIKIIIKIKIITSALI
jgi:hypothetical protein